MKIAALVAQYLLGTIFFVLGLNGFLRFIPIPEHSGTAGQFLDALYTSHYMAVVWLIEVLTAALLLMNRYAALALTLLGPVVANIFLYDVLMDHSSLPTGLVLVPLWMLAAFRVRAAFAGLFQRH